ncbi:MAG: cysteine desulfurase family protein, partial [Pseudomonadota bacterium]
MTGRVYLDWNASAPLRPEARDAALAAMDRVGNPASVHAEGREARAIVERARAQVAALAGCEPGEVVFTSGATEAAALALSGAGEVSALETEHDCVAKWADRLLPVGADGAAAPVDAPEALGGVVCIQAANSETGVVQPAAPEFANARRLTDMVQVAGRRPVRFESDFALLSAHKLGGPRGVGALLVRDGIDLPPLLRGGGQELGRRSGTENVAGIVGFGAAAEAALRDLQAGVWERVEKVRKILESRLFEVAPELILVGEGADRLPNTVCVAVPGWKGETQVMQMDLAGFAISAGSACASGKVGPSRA